MIPIEIGSILVDICFVYSVYSAMKYLTISNGVRKILV